MEVWKSLLELTVNGDYYEISNLGNLRSIDRITYCKNGVGKHFKSRKKAKKENNRGYVMTSLFKDGSEKTLLIHRLVALAFIPNPNNLPEVNHKDGNKRNNCVDNLEWMTSKENQNHARRSGLSNQHGQYSVNSKLKDHEAIEIRKLWDTGDYSQVKLSSIFNVSTSVIARVIKRKAYTHI